MNGRKNPQDILWNKNYILAWTDNFLIHFSFALIVPLMPLYLSQTFGADKQDIGLCLAGYSVMSLLVRPFIGYIVDTFDRKLVLIICNFFFFSMFTGYLVAGSLAMFTIFRTMHGMPFGAVTVAANTAAIDALPSSRRTEGIGYFGLSNNMATAIGPAIAVYVLQAFGNDFQALFWLSFIVSLIGVAIDFLIKLPARESVPEKKVISFDRFFLTKGFKEAVAIFFLAIAHGIVMTYVAIYGKDELGITTGTGMFFTLFAIGLIVSRLTGAHALRENRISRNVSMGLAISLCGFLLFAVIHSPWAYYSSAFIIGMGNGHMYPGFQNMFINLAEHNQRGTACSSILTSWDAGVGIGVLLGGVLAEHLGYNTAFWGAVAMESAGVLYYFLQVRRHFEINKLR